MRKFLDSRPGLPQIIGAMLGILLCLLGGRIATLTGSESLGIITVILGILALAVFMAGALVIFVGVQLQKCAAGKNTENNVVVAAIQKEHGTRPTWDQVMRTLIVTAITEEQKRNRK